MPSASCEPKRDAAWVEAPAFAAGVVVELSHSSRQADMLGYSKRGRRSFLKHKQKEAEDRIVDDRHLSSECSQRLEFILHRRRMRSKGWNQAAAQPKRDESVSVNTRYASANRASRQSLCMAAGATNRRTAEP